MHPIGAILTILNALKAPEQERPAAVFRTAVQPGRRGNARARAF